MSVADNLLLGRHPSRFGWLDRRAVLAEATRLLELVGLNVPPDRSAGELPLGQQQLLEIAKALGRRCRIIVMDEPTSALTAVEVNQLFGLISGLKAQRCGVVYITHKMDEIYRIGDRITVLRDGRMVGSRVAGGLPPSQLIQWMVGREITEQYPTRDPVLGSERLRLEAYSVEGAVRNINVALRAGEILGIAGLQGSGATELLMGLFGCGSVQGRVFLDGTPLIVRSPLEAISHKLAMITNDRKTTGVVLPMSVIENTVMAADRSGWRNPTSERDRTASAATALQLRAASLDMEVGELSGGNQQKVVLAKWMLTEPSVLLLDEPTRGVDVGAKREIYQWILEWARKGATILLISTELPELLALSDRIMVLHRGEVIRILDRSEATPERVIAAAMGDAA
jgi:ribose transport system ATP-binding protein